MRTRRRSISKITALEILSEPLTLLVLLAAVALEVLAPVFHYHQFGEATRMARDAALSSIFVGGLVLAVFGTVRAFRREIESGTLEMALAHPISRKDFFLAKTFGAFLAYCVFVLVLSGVGVSMVVGAHVGGEIADEAGTLPRIWGPSVCAGVGTILLPLAWGAFQNRFFHARFVRTTIFSSLGFSLLSALALSVWAKSVLVGTLAPAFLLLVAFSSILLVASAAFATRFKANVAVSLLGLVLLACLPFVGNYYVAEMLANGGAISLLYFVGVVAAAIPAILAFSILGVLWANQKL